MFKLNVFKEVRMAQSRVYRGTEAAFGWRRREVAAALEAEAKSPGLATLRDVYAARVARVAAAVASLVGMAVVVFMLLAPLALGRDVTGDGLATWSLLLSLPVAGLCFVIARSFGRRLAQRGTTPATLLHALGEDRFWDAPPSILDLLRARLQRIEGLSLALPLAAIAMAGPLTIHALVWGVAQGGLEAKDFDVWIAMSLAIVGHAHVTFAVLAADHGSKLAKGEAGWSKLKVLGVVVLVAAVPGVVLFGLPPVLTAVTGAPLIVLMFRWAKWRLERERAAIAIATLG
ncbi:MAG: hypothetical protein R3B72_50225 [Polyangiaceae bacterium]